MFSSKEQTYLTPQPIVQASIRVLGGINLDPCAETPGPDGFNVPAKHHFTIEDDGLAHGWYGTVFMNPPYGRVLPQWIDKLMAEYEVGNIPRAIVLVAARTDTRWWAKLSHHTLCLVRGRLKFSDGGSAPFPSAIFYLGLRGSWQFAREFSAFGDIWTTIIPFREERL